MYQYDCAIIGAGPGGYVAAIRAAQLGLKTVIIEKDQLGGVCLNIGCIPSKALLHQAELFNAIPELAAMGLQVDTSGFSYASVHAASRQAASKLAKGVDFLLKKNKVDIVKATATIADPHTLSLSNGTSVTAKNIIIATGSRPREIPGFVFDEQRILSSTGALMQDVLPRSVCILGGGAIGIEFGYLWRSFGSQVTIVEAMAEILPAEDCETVAVLKRSMTKQGVVFRSGSRAVSVSQQDGICAVVLQNNNEVTETIHVEKVLVVVGRVPNTEGLGLDSVGIRANRGFIPVGDYYQTHVPSIFAIGDVVNSPMLAHVASKEGEIAVEHIAGHQPPLKIDPHEIPGAIYSHPQLASFGYSEEQAKALGLAFKKATFPYRAIGKAVATGTIEGLIKVLIDTQTDQLLGASIVGAQATELIHELLLAKTAHLGCEKIARMIHAHPTISEGVMEAMRAAGGWAIHA